MVCERKFFQEDAWRHTEGKERGLGEKPGRRPFGATDRETVSRRKVSVKIEVTRRRSLRLEERGNLRNFAFQA